MKTALGHGLLLLLVGCYGQSGLHVSQVAGSSAPPVAESQVPEKVLGRCGAHPLEAPLTHLTPRQLSNALFDLLGKRPPEAFTPPNARVEGYENDSRRGELSAGALAVYVRAVEATIAASTVRPTCAGEEVPCIESWVRSFGRRAFRRPLSEEEVRIFTQLHATLRAEADFQVSTTRLLQALLLSPQFLYWTWLGDDFSIAASMAAFLWNGLPDDALLDAAARGELRDAASRALHAERMLADSRAAGASADFHEQYLRLENLDSAGRDEVLYPLWSPQLLKAMREETRRFTARAVASPEGTLASLLTSSETEVNAALAGLYGLDDAPADDRTWAQVTLDPQQRAGILTHASLLTTRAHPITTSPIQRGYFVLERLLCQPLPPPPASLDLKLPEATPDMTTREFYEPTRTQPACTGCHTLINPLGYAFEHYDPLGAWRDLELGDPQKPIDAVVELVDHGDELSGRIDGAVELSALLAASDSVADCYAKHWFGYAHAQHVEADSCGVEAVQRSFRESGGNLRALLKAIVVSDAFVERAEQRCE